MSFTARNARAARNARFKAHIVIRAVRTDTGDLTEVQFQASATKGSPAARVLSALAAVLTLWCTGPADAWRILRSE